MESVVPSSALRSGCRWRRVKAIHEDGEEEKVLEGEEEQASSPHRRKNQDVMVDLESPPKNGAKNGSRNPSKNLEFCVIFIGEI